jgi:hypothetical protein
VVQDRRRPGPPLADCADVYRKPQKNIRDPDTGFPLPREWQNKSALSGAYFFLLIRLNFFTLGNFFTSASRFKVLLQERNFSW